RCASSVSAISLNCRSETVSEVSAKVTIGTSAGFTLEEVGGYGRLRGSVDPAALIADCTSWAAASMSRLRSNCSVTWLMPNELDDVMVCKAGICPNCRSSGAVTSAAIVSGLAPGSWVVTWMVGKSTCGSAETGSHQ